MKLSWPIRIKPKDNKSFGVESRTNEIRTKSNKEGSRIPEHH